MNGFHGPVPSNSPHDAAEASWPYGVNTPAPRTRSRARSRRGVGTTSPSWSAFWLWIRVVKSAGDSPCESSATYGRGELPCLLGHYFGRNAKSIAQFCRPDVVRDPIQKSCLRGDDKRRR